MSKLAKPFKASMDAPYYDRGRYLFEVKMSKVNSRGEPYLNLRCIGSHDGRRINSYYGMNFFVNAESDKQRALHERLLSSLLTSLGITELTDMEQIPVGTKLGVFISKSGYSPLPSFFKAEQFTGYTSKPAATEGGDMGPPDVYCEFTPSDEELDNFFEDPFPESTNAA